MKWILSRYNHDISYLPEYTDDYVLYDRSESPLEGSIIVPNIGSDLYDKFTYIIDNYDNLPDIAVYTKANLFKYITKEEFDSIKDTRVPYPLLTMHHKTALPVSFYGPEEGGGVVYNLYHEINNEWYLNHHKAQKAPELREFLGMRGREYNAFAPGSNYILTKEAIHRHPKEFYVTLRSYLEWDVYPGEAQMIERNLAYIWLL